MNLQNVEILTKKILQGYKFGRAARTSSGHRPTLPSAPPQNGVFAFPSLALSRVENSVGNARLDGRREGGAPTLPAVQTVRSR